MSLVVFVLAVTQVAMCLVIWRVLKFEKAVIKAFDDFNSAHQGVSMNTYNLTNEAQREFVKNNNGTTI